MLKIEIDSFKKKKKKKTLETGLEGIGLLEFKVFNKLDKNINLNFYVQTVQSKACFVMSFRNKTVLLTRESSYDV